MRVLVVEDEETIAREVQAALRQAGYVVDHARDGENAWFRASTEDYDGLVLDLGMRRLDRIAA